MNFLTTDAFVSWISDNVINIDDKIDNNEYKNYEQVNEDLKTIRDKIDATATESKKNAALHGFDSIKKGYLEPNMNEAVKDSNESIITERNVIISKATTLSELENARTVDINYLDSTFEKIRTIAETRQEKLFESQIDDAREMIIGVGSVEEIRDILRTIPSEIRDKVGAKQKLDRLIRAGLEEPNVKIGRI